MRTCGVQLHKFPVYDNAGVSRAVSVVGTRGAKKILSCPATMEVFSQSRRIVPVRSRTMPNAVPFGVFGKPPPKSKFMLELVCAPAMSGPKAYTPSCDWRNDPEKAPEVPGVTGAVATCGKSRLSTAPRVTSVFSKMIPENRTRYFDPLSTLV